MEEYRKYTDYDDNEYELQPHESKKGDRACIGCAFIFGNSEACRMAKSCTPEDKYRNRLLKGRYVWVQTSWGCCKSKKD